MAQSGIGPEGEFGFEGTEGADLEDEMTGNEADKIKAGRNAREAREEEERKKAAKNAHNLRKEIRKGLKEFLPFYIEDVEKAKRRETVDSGEAPINTTFKEISTKKIIDGLIMEIQKHLIRVYRGRGNANNVLCGEWKTTIKTSEEGDRSLKIESVPTTKNASPNVFYINFMRRSFDANTGDMIDKLRPYVIHL